jgi:hypothetical protein
MNVRAKRVPRLWCALQGLLPLDDCLAAQRAELAWPPETDRVAAGVPARQGRILPTAKNAHENSSQGRLPPRR